MSPEVRSTYRVQLTRDFNFDDAAALLDYLSDLGISHLYCSPYLQARRGSTHGYDVVDQRRVSDELGGSEAHERLLEALERHGMGHILDVVPNHMTIAERGNEWWWDVLKHGPASHHAAYFDIDWDPPESKLVRKILMPVLGDHYGRELERGGLNISHEDGEWVLRYHEHVLPLDPSTLPTDPANLSIDEVHDLLEQQHYRLAFWRTAGQELNYRRFFSINDLAALRMENPDVFDRVHELVLKQIAEGRLDGLRIDHIDGLRDPLAYLKQLRAWAPDAYVVVEKILDARSGEELPGSWPVQGTTGYDFLARVNALLVDGSSEAEFDEIYRSFTGEELDLHQLEYHNKRLLIDTELATDLERLTELFVQVCEDHRDTRDFTRIELREALRETLASFRVYRTYVSDVQGTLAPHDIREVQFAISSAQERLPTLDQELMGFLESVLLLQVDGDAATELALRLQQTTSPVMAKGVEDTTFYVYNRLACLNEVGGDPGGFGMEVAEFHAAMVRAQERWPRTMLATSTHDTKRSEDVRARIAVLSEIPAAWREAIEGWRWTNERHRSRDMPDRNIEYLMYQTLVGAWPIDVERMVAFMAKAAKEAKTHTSWVTPDRDYDRALESFVRGVMSDTEFTASLESFVRPLVAPGRINSLTQTLVKLFAPGIPDIYQGCEVWDLSLVDPDNRRPVDFAERRALLAKIRGSSIVNVMAMDELGAPKLHLIDRALTVRGQMGSELESAGYAPLTVAGERRDHVVGFTRGNVVAAVGQRLPLTVRGEWSDTSVLLPEGRWTNVLTGDELALLVPLSDLLARFPVALLTRAS